jgi:hypothetical protein
VEHCFFLYVLLAQAVIINWPEETRGRTGRRRNIEMEVLERARLEREGVKGLFFVSA